MVNGLHLYSAFTDPMATKVFYILPHVHPFTHSYTDMWKTSELGLSTLDFFFSFIRCNDLEFNLWVPYCIILFYFTFYNGDTIIFMVGYTYLSYDYIVLCCIEFLVVTNVFTIAFLITSLLNKSSFKKKKRS